MEGEVAPTGRRNGFVLALVTVGVVLVALVAAGGHVPIATEGGGGVGLAPTRSPSQPVEVEPQPSPRTGDPIDVPGAGAIAVALQAALIISGLAILVSGGWALVHAWARRDEPAGDDVDEPAPPLRPDEIVDVLDEGLDALASGPVDDVVIACWVRLEDAAAAAGVERMASETPAELASRVLGDLHAPAPAVERLLVRYRTARFSDHPLDESDRAVAIRSLEEIRAAIVGASA
jgi:Domain of unknown function (DUF4129)